WTNEIFLTRKPRQGRIPSTAHPASKPRSTRFAGSAGRKKTHCRRVPMKKIARDSRRRGTIWFAWMTFCDAAIPDAASALKYHLSRPWSCYELQRQFWDSCVITEIHPRIVDRISVITQPSQNCLCSSSLMLFRNDRAGFGGIPNQPQCIAQNLHL